MVERKKWLPEEVAIASGETAPHRYSPSFPARFLVENKLIEGRIFDWGCGYGFDVNYFLKNGIEAVGWDPVHKPETHPDNFPAGCFNWVHCAFVLNTLPEPELRTEVLEKIYNFLPQDGYLVITLRATQELKRQIKPEWKNFSDGYITKKGTFQRGYTSEEAENLLGLFSEVTTISKNPVMVIAKK